MGPPSASARSTARRPFFPNTMWRAQLMQGFFSMTAGGQNAFVIFRFTSACGQRTRTPAVDQRGQNPSAARATLVIHFIMNIANATLSLFEAYMC